MARYKVPVRLDQTALAIVEADGPEQARKQASETAWKALVEEGTEDISAADVTEVTLVPAEEADFRLGTLHQHLRQAHGWANELSEAEPHPALHVLEAAQVLAGQGAGDPGQTLSRAAEDCRAALGATPAAWAAMRGLLQESLAQLEQLRSVTESLDDGDGADGQDWRESREAASDLASRIKRWLAGSIQPAGVPLVRVDVRGGLAVLVAKPPGVAVELRDYDQGMIDPRQVGLVEDADGTPGDFYTLDYWAPEADPQPRRSPVAEEAGTSREPAQRTLHLRFRSTSVYNAEVTVPPDFDPGDEAALRDLIVERRLEDSEFLDLKAGGLDIERVRELAEGWEEVQ